MGKKYFFWGRECAHCRRIHPLVEKMENETGIKLTKLEVWHDKENFKIMRKYEKPISKACGEGVGLGTPAFFDEETGEALCGEQPYEVLKEWAMKKKK